MENHAINRKQLLAARPVSLAVSLPSTAASHHRLRNAIILCLAFLLGMIFSLSIGAPAVQAGWFGSDDPQPVEKPRTVKKAGLKPFAPQKKQTPAGKMLSQVTSGPKDFMNNTRSLFSSDKPVSHSASRTVPRKQVADKQQKPSMLRRLFTPAPPAQPRTVTEWMKQSRPK